MKKICYGLLLSLLVALPAIGFCQKDTSSAAKTYIDFDPSTMNTLNLPADSPFDMKIHLKNQTALHDVRLVRNRGDQKLSKFLSNNNFRFMRWSWDSTSPTLNIRFNYRYNKDTTDQINAIRNGVPKQEPAGVLKTGNGYTLMIFSEINPRIFSPGDNSTFFEQCYLYCKRLDSGAMAKDSPGIKAVAMKTFDQIISDFKVKISDSGFKLFGLFTSSTAVTFYRKHIYRYYKQNEDSVTAISGDMDNRSAAGLLVANYNQFHPTLATATQWLLGAASRKGCSGCLPPCADSSCLARLLLDVMWEMQPADWKNVNEGIFSLDKALGGPPSTGKPDDPAKRSARIDSTVRLLLALRLVLGGLEMTGTMSPGIAAINSLDQIVTDELSVLAAEKVDLARLIAWNKLFQNLVIEHCNDQFQSLDVYGAGSYIMDFSTRSSVYITPVFGYAVYGFQNNFTDFSPYLGFQINFKPIVSKIPFRLIRPKTLLQRLCFTTAWTLRSVSYPAKREDFFGNSTSLITALGFKFGHVVMLNVGTLWFKELNPNPVLTNKKIVSTPLIGLSANFSISQLVNGFTSLIPSL